MARRDRNGPGARPGERAVLSALALLVALVPGCAGAAGGDAAPAVNAGGRTASLPAGNAGTGPAPVHGDTAAAPIPAAPAAAAPAETPPPPAHADSPTSRLGAEPRAAAADPLPLGAASAAAPPTASPLHPAIASFAERLAADVAADSVGSLAAAVVVGDSVVWAGAFGVADRETGAPATTETLYRIGSITKTVTALALLRLVEAGVVGLDEPVALRVPELTGLAGFQATDRPITYADLASHTAGLEREPSSSRAARGGGGWERKTVRSIPLTEVRASPGEEYRYSNIGYAILGLALERAAGLPFEALVARDVLAPLGMRSTFFRVPGSARHRLAAGYVNLEDGTIDPRVPRAEHAGRGYKVPSEGLYSTVGDMARLLMALTGPAMDDDARALLLADRTPDDDDRSGYGLGLQLTRLGDTLLAGHSGTVAGYTSYLVFDPAARVGVVLLRSYNRGATNLGAEAQRLVMELGEGR